MECLVCDRHSDAVDVPGGSIYEDELVFVGAGMLPGDAEDPHLHVRRTRIDEWPDAPTGGQDEVARLADRLRRLTKDLL